MVAIATLPRPLPAPARWPRPQPDIVPDDAIRLVVPGHRPVVLGAAGLARVVGLAVLVVASVFAIAYLATADAGIASATIPVLDATHVVTAGESMWSIANDVAPAGEAAGYVERLVEVNGTAVVAPGQVVALPVP